MARWRETAEHITKCPAHIFTGQEVDDRLAESFALAGWHRSDERYGGSQRTDATPQLFIGAWPTLCTSLQTLHSHSRTFYARPQPAQGQSSLPCHWLTAFVGFRWYMGGMDGLTITTIHLHRDVATLGDDSERWRDCAHLLANDFRSGGVRMVTGDANKSLFRLATWMEEREGLQMELISRACGLNINEPVPSLSERGLKEAMLHDSCGIWILGPRGPCRPLTLDSRCVVAACHPALFENVSATQGNASRRSASATGKVLTRGYVDRTYVGTEAHDHETKDVPSRACVDAILRIWQAHERVPLDAGDSVWKLNFMNLLVPPDPQAPRAAQPPVLALAGPSVTPPPPPTPPPAIARAASAIAARRDLRPDQDAAARALAPAGLLRDILVNPNEAFASTLAMIGVPLQRQSWFPRAVPSRLSDLPPFPFVTEVPCYGHDWDPTGGVWGRPGHAALMVKVGVQGTHSSEGAAAKKTKDDKKKRWHQTGERSWPHWIYHESEATYWLPGVCDSGRGWSGWGH